MAQDAVSTKQLPVVTTGHQGCTTDSVVSNLIVVIVLLVCKISCNIQVSK